MSEFDELRSMIEGGDPLADTPAPEVTDAPPAVTSEGTLPPKLEALTHRALEQSDKIFDLPLDQSDGQFGAVLRAKTAAIGATLSAKVRVDEAALRQPRRDDAVLKRLLASIDQAEAKMRAAGTCPEGNREADAHELARLKAVGLIMLEPSEFDSLANIERGDDDGVAKKEPPGG